MREPIGIALLYPELLGTYGDGGNAAVLAQRLRWRGLEARVLDVRGGEPVPETCHLYLLGGGEDGPQALAVRELAASGGLGRAIEGGAAVLAVCAGFQILGRTFIGLRGASAPGLGLLDCDTRRGQGPRMVGELLVEPDASLGLPALTGYENHAGVTLLGPSARPLGRAVVGHGNGAPAGQANGEHVLLEGIVAGRVVGTYLHGPVLARNPALADLLLSWVAGPLEPLDDAEVDALRAERLAAAQAVRGRPRRRPLALPPS